MIFQNPREGAKDKINALQVQEKPSLAEDFNFNIIL